MQVLDQGEQGPLATVQGHEIHEVEQARLGQLAQLGVDEAATQAAAALQEMTAMLEDTNRRAEAVFAELARTNAGGASAGGHLAVLPR